MNKLGIFVREKRKSLALTQMQFARKLKISAVSLSKIENGKIMGNAIMRKLATYFNLSTRLLREMMLVKEEEE